MSYVTVQVRIDHGHILPREPNKLPENGHGLLTILADTDDFRIAGATSSQRIALPLIQGDGQRVINPSPTELDASFWGD